MNELREVWSEFNGTQKAATYAFGVLLVGLLVIQVWFPGVFTLNIR